jgi:hypothetical protein
MVRRLLLIIFQCDHLLIYGYRHAHHSGGQAVSALGQRIRFVDLNDCPSAVLDATAHLHEQITIIRDRRRALQTALAQAHATRSSEPHPLLVSLDALGDSDDEVDEEQDRMPELDIRVGALSLVEAEDGSIQFFGIRPFPLTRRALPALMLPTTSASVRWATSHLVFRS